MMLVMAVISFIQMNSLQVRGLLWSWSYGSWINNYLCNQCLSPLMAGQWFSPGTLVTSNNKTDCHDITEVVLKVALNTINSQIQCNLPNRKQFTLHHIYYQPYIKYLIISDIQEEWRLWRIELRSSFLDW